MKVKAALALLYKILGSVNPFDRAESNLFPPISMRRENESGACHKASSRLGVALDRRDAVRSGIRVSVGVNIEHKSSIHSSSSISNLSYRYRKLKEEI
jgi:hypothetical protein